MNLTPWNHEIAQKLAAEDNLLLTQAHFLILDFLRTHFLEYGMLPGQRPLVKLLKTHFGPEKSNSLYLNTLFPKGPLAQGARLAGLPKSTRCL